MGKHFNTKYTRQVLIDVEHERKRTTERGLSGAIPYACEDIGTHWGVKLGVLGEEFGEVCKKIIETPDGLMIEDDQLYHELIQVASVAVSMAESIVARGQNSRSDEFQSMSTGPSMIEEESKPFDHHMEVLKKAHAIYIQRNTEYRDVWKDYGWRGSLMQLRTLAERSWRTLWSATPGLDTTVFNKVDDLYDLINYAVFTIRNIDDDNRDGTWGYPDAVQ